MSNVYTHGHHESVLRSHRWRTAENSAAYLLPLLSRGCGLLDVGCGPGTITMDLADVVGPDGSGHRARAHRGRPRPRPGRGRPTRGLANVEFAVGDVHDLDLPGRRASDVVHAHQVLQHVGDPVRALREMRRVCRPGGIVAVRDSDYAASPGIPASRGLDAGWSCTDGWPAPTAREPDAGRRLLSWARAAGLPDVTAGSSTWCFATPEERAWWGGLWADRVVGSDLAEQAVERGPSRRWTMLAGIADGWRHWAAQEDGWFSVLHGEILARA